MKTKLRAIVGRPQTSWSPPVSFIAGRPKAASNKYCDIDIVNFPFLDGDVPRSASYGVYI